MPEQDCKQYTAILQ